MEKLTGFDPTRIGPATLTRPVLPFPPTVLGKVGTDSKLERRATYPCRPRCRKLTRTPVIWARKLAAKPVFTVVDFAGVWAHFQLGSTPHVSSIISRPTTTTRDAGVSPNDHQKACGFWSFDSLPATRVGGHGHHRWTHRSLSYQTLASRRRRMNSGDRWPARVF